MVRGVVTPLLINKASEDPRFQDHPGLHLYGIESYIAVPLTRQDGSYFGTLCALDTQPANLSPDDFDIFYLLAQLIAFELEADEQRRKREAELRAMEDFIAIASHDLRQPLTSLYGGLQLLARHTRRGVESSDLVPRVDGLLGHAQRLIRLSDTLLDAARIEVGTLSLDSTEWDLAEQARQVVDEARTLAPKHTFVLDAPTTLPFYGDKVRLGQVLRNLLDNAAKYAPAEHGPVVLTLEDRKAEDEPPQVFISLRDSGAGVSDEELGQLFQRHYRAPDAVEQGIGGSGLGLYIVQQIVAAHGGSIRAKHAPGGGLLVEIVLPQTRGA